MSLAEPHQPLAPTHRPVPRTGRQRPRYKVRGVFIYCRISDPRNRVTTERQRARAIQYAHDNIDAPLLEVFIDARSGYLRRRQYEDMMLKARLGLCSHIVLYDFDRFGRDRLKMLQDFEDLELLQIEVHDCTEGFISHARAGEKALQAENELRATSRRVRDAMLDRAKDEENYAMPRRVPVGYKPTPGKPGQPHKDPERAPLVQQIFERYDAGESEGSLARWWNEQTGDRKRNTSIRQMLRNEYYAGYDYFNKESNSKLRTEGRYNRDESEWVKRDHDIPLIDRDLFWRVQAKLDQNERRGHVYSSEPQHSLTGLIDCNTCSGRLVVRPPRGRHQADICCDVCKITRSYRRVETALRSLLERIPLDTDEIAQHKIERPKLTIDDLNRKITLVREARGKLLVKHELGEISKADYDAAMAETEARLSTLEQELATNTRAVTQDYLAEQTAKWLSTLSNWTEILDSETSTPAKQNRIYRQCCDRVVLDFATDTLTVTWSVGVAAHVGEGIAHVPLVPRARAANRVYKRS